MNVRLIAVTQPVPSADGPQTAEELMVYCARVSSPQNQADHLSGERLLRYCLRKGHWSVFEQASMTLEIETSRAISAQILRHRSFTFQEFSQRYAETQGFEVYEARRQDDKNRQASHDDLDEDIKEWFRRKQEDLTIAASMAYDDALRKGIAKESARFFLPMSTTTRLYMNGSVRSWLTYFMSRRAPETQKEHRDIAETTYALFREQFPLTSTAFEDAHGPTV